MRPTDYCVIITTCPDRDSAGNLANLLVETRRAACVQLIPIESIYRWQDKLCKEFEIALHIKSKAEHFDQIAATIKTHHPYAVPEIIQLPITGGFPGYLDWIADCTS